MKNIYKDKFIIKKNKISIFINNKINYLYILYNFILLFILFFYFFLLSIINLQLIFYNLFIYYY